MSFIKIQVRISRILFCIRWLIIGFSLIGFTSCITGEGVPNMIIILADDLGYGDIECYGNPHVKTPCLNRLASEGMRFTDFHADGAMCSPTRGALLTGRYPQRNGVANIGDMLNPGEVVIAQLLRNEADYMTGAFGKWHISGHNSPPEHYCKYNPVHYGFDEYVGYMTGFIDHVSHMDDRGEPDWWHNDQRVDEQGYATHLVVDHAIRFIRRNHRKPFFAYIPLPAVHFPWMFPQDDPHFARGGTYKTAGDPKNSRLGPYDGTEMIQDALHRMIEDMDSCIGRIIETLEQLGIEKNTFLMFLSDDGGYIHYRGHNLNRLNHNGPFRGQKGELYEGGHRIPAIAWWPGHIVSCRVSNATVMTHDLFPTCLDLAGINQPLSNGPNALNGISLVPLLTGNTSVIPGRTLYWSTYSAAKDNAVKGNTGDRSDPESNHYAVREKNWKLIIIGNKDPELYNLRQDPGETRNVAGQYPDRVHHLLGQLSEWKKSLEK